MKLVENYIPSFPVKNTEKLWAKAQKRTEQIICDVKKKKRQRFQIHTVLNSIYHRRYPAYDRSCDGSFSIGENCNGCGLCDKICPVDNIKMQDGRPRFLHHCDHCLSCLNHCPQTAIDWKDKTKGKERYRNPRVTAKELISFRQKEKKNR